ncbi:MAG: type II toxin-antitoxin system RelE/ParE family toxin [Vicinamibacteria bacterium]|nr:type II toxin-antitoxin system RelE/ParE family toxin [Vicinamibacteria bacterium]
MVRSFGDRETEALFRGVARRRFGAIARVAQRKLMQLDAARRLDDLRAFPGSHLEALKGNRRGQYSIRVNDQYRVCFTWRDGDAEGVEVVDYH